MCVCVGSHTVVITFPPPSLPPPPPHPLHPLTPSQFSPIEEVEEEVEDERSAMDASTGKKTRITSPRYVYGGGCEGVEESGGGVN